MITYNETPLQEIKNSLLDKAGVSLLIKREDMNHPFVSGNKWWKLKYNLEAAIKLEHKTLLTFGGAYSNHIYATAAAAYELGLKSIGIIRGEDVLPLNHTLKFAKEHGMDLHYVSREVYRTKTSSSFIENLHHQFGNFYLIPEGGTNKLAVHGCAEWGQTLLPIEFDTLIFAVGTGGTMAGLIQSLGAQKQIIGVSTLKGDFLKNEVDTLLVEQNPEVITKKKLSTLNRNWSVLTSYHHGGYGKTTEELMHFIETMKQNHNLPLDPVYTGKLLWAVMEEVKKGSFNRGSIILALHTGGMQGANPLTNL